MGYDKDLFVRYLIDLDKKAVVAAIKKMKDSEELCDYCDLKEIKGARGTPSGYISCEGSRCDEAYETYLSEIEAEPRKVFFDKTLTRYQ